MLENAFLWLIEGFMGIIASIINMFPDMPTQSFDMFPSDAGTYLYWLGNIVNVDALIFVIMVIITYELAMIFIRGFLFVWRLMPFT